MNDQSRVALTGAAAAAEATSGKRGATEAQPEDAWDRLAALAFGGAASAGGCSEHAHDYDCTCAAERESDEAAD
ncbi:hypothetical protein [Actinospica sp.]|uniref:hypothetical protein n=1 Tax=Actinospica sp. TaxID=1872142 RepID=UPI002CC69B8E|nr:hypothetical protein [Actinospica sp.]HWG25123.1 hypothetical protein [Actinospica sp.]